MAKSNKKATAAKLQDTDLPTPTVGDASRWLLGIIFFFPLFTYLFSTAHSVTFEDSGVFIGAASSLGLPQPPGYPLYTLLAWLFTHLPVGEIAFRVHLFSGLCAAGAVTFFYLATLKILGSHRWHVAVVAAFVFAFADTFWAQAIVAEVYPLHIFLFSVLFFITLKIKKDPSRKNLVVFGLIYGLALANHWPLLILASPLFLAFAWSRRREILKLVWLWAGLALIVASGFYLFMMWRSQQNPAVSFLGPLESIKDLLNYIGRSYYRTLEEKWDNRVIDKLLFFADGVYGVLWREWYLAGAAVLIGIWRSRRVFSKLELCGLAFAFLATTFFLTFTITFEFNTLNQNVMRVFHLVPIFVSALMAAIGLEFVFSKLGVRAFLGTVVVAVLPALTLNYLKNDLRTDRFAENYARFVLDAIPVKEKSQALIAGTDADVGPLAYVHIALGERKDLRLYTQSGVFFRDRLFDPFILQNKVRLEKTGQFFKNEGLVYSTKSIDVFNSAKDLPFSLHFNGLFYEISTGGATPLTFGSEYTEKVVKLLDDYVAHPRKANWAYHRETIASRLCNFIVLRGVEHPAFKESPACMQVWARHLSKNKRYAEADAIFKQLIADGRWMINAERHLIRYHLLVNRMEQINSEPGDLQYKHMRVLSAVEEVKDGLTEYPHCGNSVFTVIESLRSQVKLPEDVLASFELFKKCKKNDKK